MSVLLQRVGLLSSAAVAGFTPADLFAASEPGFWNGVNPTTTNTTVDNRVAQWDDASPNGNHLLQGTASLQPFLRNPSGSLYKIEFDGVEDILSLAADIGLYSAGATTIGFAGKVPTSADDYIIACGNSTDNDTVYAIARSAQTNGARQNTFIRNDAGTTLLINDDDTDADWYDNTVRVFRIEDDGSGVRFFRNGVEDTASYSYTRSGALTTDRFSVGALLRGAASNHAQLDIYALVAIGRTLTAQEASDLDNWLSEQSGVTL